MRKLAHTNKNELIVKARISNDNQMTVQVPGEYRNLFSDVNYFIVSVDGNNHLTYRPL